MPFCILALYILLCEIIPLLLKTTNALFVNVRQRFDDSKNTYAIDVSTNIYNYDSLTYMLPYQMNNMICIYKNEHVQHRKGLESLNETCKLS